MTVCNPPFVHLKNKSRFTASCFVRLTAVFLLPVDLPFLDSDDIIRLIAAYSENQLIISPDARHEGTNAMLLPPLATFTFQYGPHSFAKHLAEAQKQQLQTHILPSPDPPFRPRHA